MNKQIPIFAHRGASGYKFENSMDAFKKALELGANGIEIDVQQTSDGELYVIHDTNLKRLTGVNRLVSELSSTDLQRLTIGKPFWRLFLRKPIPTFQFIIDWANMYNMPLNVELKESFLANDASLQKMLPHLLLPVGSHISSFHDELLRMVKRIRPDIETALLITKTFDFEKLSEYPHIDSIHAHKKYYHRRLLQSCMQHGKDVRFYAIEGDEPFLQHPHPVVKGWITDYPDRIQKDA